MTKRRNVSDKSKAAVALKALCGDKTVQEIATNEAKHELEIASDVLREERREQYR